MEKFREILDHHHWPAQNIQPNTSIKDIEALIGFVLPRDYISFLNNYAGHESHIGLEYVRLWDLDEVIETNIGYGINGIPNTLGIGSNGASEFIAIEMLDDKTYRIVISPYIDLDQEYHIEIGFSFTDFLVRLNDNKNWFK
jgi:hypothetical protein